jgi:hypothetical protein
MAQAVSHRPGTAEFQVQSQAGQCGICVEKTGAGTGFFFFVESPRFSPVSNIPPPVLLAYSFICHGRYIILATVRIVK